MFSDDPHIPELIEAMTKRVSVRRYEEGRWDAQDQLKLAEYAQTRVIGVRIAVAPCDDGLFTGMVGSVGAIKGAPAAAAIITEADDRNGRLKAGYAGEAFVLRCTAAGWGTCWVSGTYRRETAKRIFGLTEDEQLHAVISVGYPLRDKSYEEKLQKAGEDRRPRKALASLCGLKPDAVAALPDWQREAMEAARIAPSAVNSQPWRFEPGEDGIVLRHKKHSLSGALLDCGIAMLHMELGAAKAGASYIWAPLEPPAVGIISLTERGT